MDGELLLKEPDTLQVAEAAAGPLKHRLRFELMYTTGGEWNHDFGEWAYCGDVVKTLVVHDGDQQVNLEQHEWDWEFEDEWGFNDWWGFV